MNEKMKPRDEEIVGAKPLDEDIAIDVDNVSKLYRLYPGQRARIIEWVTFGKRVYHYPFWALKDVSMKLKKGQALGLIGPNGSGKSTLLKLIAGTSIPTNGEIKVNGTVAALLELGAGFHPEFSGRQNIHMNAQIFGLSDEEIDELMPDIIQFAELDRYIDMPVRTYSSGMYARLGFAVASHVDPDILIIDEALAVGDLYFQRKSLDRIIYFREIGKTILFVSHVMPVIQRFCDEVIWLDEGKIRLRGEAKKVTKEYEMWSLRRQEKSLRTRIDGKPSTMSDRKKAEFKVLDESWGSGEARITKVEMIGADGEPRWHFEKNERDVTIRIHYFAFERLENPVIGINFHRIDGTYIFGTGNVWIEDYPLEPFEGPGYVDYTVDRLQLHKGTFFLTVAIFPEPDIPYWQNPCDFHNQMYEFTIVSEGEAHGIIPFDGRWAQKTGSEDLTRAGIPISIDFGEKRAPHYLYKGWWDIETGVDLSFAWSQKTAGLVLLQPAGADKLFAEIKSNKPDIAEDPVTVDLLSGEDLLGSAVLKDNEWHVVELAVARKGRPSAHQLMFRVNPIWRPCEFGNPDDDREIGIGVTYIGFEPKTVNEQD
ncbi:MAG TPA: ABC transporter ATP-binding protein [Acidobacteriota bacterium]|nr:ABC transporter ATP-binding protein [Acidobacteriota bacterium]